MNVPDIEQRHMSVNPDRGTAGSPSLIAGNLELNKTIGFLSLHDAQDEVM